MKTKILLFVFALQLLTTVPLHSLDLGFAREDGGRPGAFLSYGAGARSLGLGKTFTGIADDASAVYWNPAGLAQLKQKELTALYNSLYERTGYSFVSYAQPLKKSGYLDKGEQNWGTMGVAIVNLNSRGFQLRDEYNENQGEAGVNETAALISYGTNIAQYLKLESESLKNLSLGINLKIVNQNIDTKSDTSYGIDAGLLATFRKLNLGLNIQNLSAPRLKLIEDTDKYPLSATIGLSYRFFKDKLITALDVSKTEQRQLKFHTGAEYSPLKLLAFRAGIDETEVATGLGLKWGNYSLDYAFAYHDAWPGRQDLGISHRFGLTVKWGGDEQRVKRQIKEQIEKETGLQVEEIRIEQMEPVEITESLKLKAESEEIIKYTVKKGDCLWNLAKELYGDAQKWPLIYQANRAEIKNPDLIYPGQIFIIPRSK